MSSDSNDRGFVVVTCICHLMGPRMPPPNIEPDYHEQAKGFVDGLVHTVLWKPATATAGGAR
jgi:hypothetical protein